MMRLEKAIEELLAAMADAYRHLPRGRGAYMGERKLMELCDRAQLGSMRCRRRVSERRSRRNTGPRSAGDIKDLKMKMAAAHPDHGGTSAAFIAARKAYVDARRRMRKRAEPAA